MKYQEKLKTLETVLDGWSYLEEVLASWEVIIKELTFMKDEPNLDVEYVIDEIDYNIGIKERPKTDDIKIDIKKVIQYEREQE